MRLVVARVGRAHGIRGEVTVEVRTDAPQERFVPGVRLHVTGEHGLRGLDAVTLAGVRDHNGTLLLTFDEVLDRTAAEALRGAVLEADVPDDVDEPDAWYDHQLVGLRVLDPAGAELGQVVAVEHPPAQDLLVVCRPDGARRLVPFVTALVPTVDVAGGTLVVDAPPGLLDDLD
ncbi:MAG TPA: ribosome maturation factor RimM [Kineosporiaceae bacterium]|nr:ribosome maturation factor RimM [Kineosporiaceae bacterium]